MADETVINGVATEDQTVDNFYDLDQNENSSSNVKVTELNRKMETLEKEKEKLISENEEIKERMKRLTVEMEQVKGADEEEMKKEIEQYDEEKKVFESIAARAVELETEVSRLQHDLISTMSEAEEGNAEIAELKRVLGEKVGKIEGLEKEIEGLKKEKVESEKRVRELERKLGVLEMREIEERSKRVRVEEEMRERIDEKEREIIGFKKKIEDLEVVVVNNGMGKKGLEDALRESEEKGRMMEFKMLQLQKEVEEAERVIGGLKERNVEAINGTVNELLKSVDDGEDGGLKFQWPVVAAGSTGVIAVAAALVYVFYLRRR